jgi:hypothetical protein
MLDWLLNLLSQLVAASIAGDGPHPLPPPPGPGGNSP